MPTWIGVKGISAAIAHGRHLSISLSSFLSSRDAFRTSALVHTYFVASMYLNLEPVNGSHICRAPHEI